MDKTQIDIRQQEAEILTKLYQKKHPYSKEAIAALIARYRPEIKHSANSFRGRFHKKRPQIPTKDYEAVASASIQDAAKNYDSSKGASFKTYLYHYICWDCYHYAEENGDYLKVFEQRNRHCDQDEEKEESAAVYAIPWDDLADDDLIHIANENPRREREKKEARKTVQSLRKFLTELLESLGLQESQNRPSVPQKRAALVLKYIDFFLKHADDPAMGRTMKKAFLESIGKKNRETLDNAIDYVLKQFSLYSKTLSTHKLRSNP